MKNIIHTVLILTFLFINCVSTHIIERSDCSYCLVNGRKIKIQQINIAVDSTVVIEIKSHKKYVFPSSIIKEVSFTDSERGALQGMLISGLIGGTIGGFTGYAIGYGLTEYGDRARAGKESAHKGFIIGASFGSIVLGLPIGAAVGAKDKYVFSPESDTTTVKSK